MEGRGEWRWLLRAYRDADLGFGRSEDLFAVLDFVVDRLGVGEEGIVRTLAQQVVRQVELREDVSGRGAGLNFNVPDLAGASNNNRQFFHESFLLLRVNCLLQLFEQAGVRHHEKRDRDANIPVFGAIRTVSLPRRSSWPPRTFAVACASVSVPPRFRRSP